METNDSKFQLTKYLFKPKDFNKSKPFVLKIFRNHVTQYDNE